MFNKKSGEKMIQIVKTILLLTILSAISISNAQATIPDHPDNPGSFRQPGLPGNHTVSSFGEKLDLIGNTGSAEEKAAIGIICPYLGPLSHRYENSARKLDLKDNGLLKGIYFQCIKPEKYQWNIFLYRADDINFSTISGLHFIYDHYFKDGGNGSLVAGIGLEYMQVKMAADSAFAPLKKMDMTNSISVPYLRGGYRFSVRLGNSSQLNILPWSGIQYSGVSQESEVAVNPPGPAQLFSKKESLNDDKYLGLAGINLSSKIGHYADLEAKYSAAFNADNFLSSASAMTNIYLHRNWGLSYRVKYMEQESGSELYNIFGLAFIF